MKKLKILMLDIFYVLCSSIIQTNYNFDSPNSLHNCSFTTPSWPCAPPICMPSSIHPCNLYIGHKCFSMNFMPRKWPLFVNVAPPHILRT